MTLEYIAYAIAFGIFIAVGIAIYSVEKSRDRERYDGPIPDITDPQYWEEDASGFKTPPGVTMQTPGNYSDLPYEIGTKVHVINPYTEEFMFFEDPYLTRPSTHYIEAIVWDKEDDIYRYRIDGLKEYYGHDWLLEAVHGTVSKSFPEIDEELERRTDEFYDERFARKRIASEVSDEIDRYHIDTLLDRMNNAKSPEEKRRLLAAIESHYGNKGETT